MSVLYVTQPGAELRKQGGRLRVVKQGEILAALLLRDVQRIVLLAPVQISAAATRVFLEKGIPVLYCSLRGICYGILSASCEDVECWLAQVQHWQDMTYRLNIARSLVRTKIRHQRSLLRRQARNHPDPLLVEAANQLTRLLETIGNRFTLDQLRGVEGQAAAIYFSALGKCFRQDSIVFNGRNRRPPRDPVNALLSLGYMLLMGEVSCALMSQGLQVGLGFLHEPSRRRQALALDLLEIFRQPVIDRLTISLFNRKVFTVLDFETQTDGGVFLKQESLKRYLFMYEKTLTSSFRYKEGKQPVSFRILMREQAAEFRKCLEEGELWNPSSWEL